MQSIALGIYTWNSSAAVITDACNIEKEIIGLKISQTGSGLRVARERARDELY